MTKQHFTWFTTASDPRGDINFCDPITHTHTVSHRKILVRDLFAVANLIQIYVIILHRKNAFYVSNFVLNFHGVRFRNF